MVWSKEGDKNTKFFHTKASNRRRRRNTIHKIKTQDEEWIHDEERIGEEAVKFFSTLFSVSNICNTDDVCSHLKRCLTSDQATLLTYPYILVEIDDVLKLMGPLKAPGSDELPAIFFQKHWSIVREEVCSLVLGVLNDRMDPREINHTLIALVPKVKAPDNFSQFHPISLCNVVIKLVTKAIANRLKRVLHELISVNQSAFIPHRLITDNTLIAFEIFHYLKKKKKGKTGYFALKLDMAKSYDRMEWKFIETVMMNMKFPTCFVKLVMRCITYVSYSILINGKPGWG